MKLLYITNGINGSGGLERVLSIKASLLAEEFGYEVSILVLNDAHLDPFYDFSPKIRFYSIEVGGRPLHYLLSYKRGIQKLADDLRPDVISVCDDGLKAFFIPQFLATDAKIIYERHVSKLIEGASQKGWIHSLLTKGKWKLMDRLGNKFEKFVVLTEGNKKEWQSLRNLKVIPNPLSFYPQASSDLQSKKVICVGKISYQKGQDLLVKAWEIVHRRFPDWQLNLYGKANEDFLKTDELMEKHIFHFPPEKNIEQKYLESAIYVMSSRFEGFGMVLIEAMACGVPCISFDCDFGPADIITDNEDGFLVENGNIKQLAERIIDLIENQSLRIAMGRKAKADVKKYDALHIMEQWDYLLKV